MVFARKCCFLFMGAVLLAGLSGCGLAQNDMLVAPVLEDATVDDGGNQEDFGTREDVWGREMGEDETGPAAGPPSQKEEGPAGETDAGSESGQERPPLPWMAMVNGSLYVYSGECDDDALRCGMVDGEISGTVPEDEIPTQENESNFGTGYGYQYGMGDEIEIHMPVDDSGELHWLIFRKEGLLDGSGKEILLADAPALILKDALSSTMDCVSVRAGNYTWTYEENGEGQSFVACGAHPLDDALLAHMPTVSLSAHNGLDFAPYFFSCAVMPDSVTVRKWGKAAIGNPDTPPDSAAALEEGCFFLDLEKDCVYELILEWSQERLEERGYCGTANYAFTTS